MSDASAPSAILWDLDGTLVDTAADIAAALNTTLQALGLSPLPLELVKTLIGRGAGVLLERALAALKVEPATLLQCPREAALKQLLARFEQAYLALEMDNHTQSACYPTVLSTLATLEPRVPMAIVTNKPEAIAKLCAARLGLTAFIPILIGGDTLSVRKPHPDPLREACRRLKVAASAALMVGDSHTDWAAAQAVPMRVALLSYGYHAGINVHALADVIALERVSDLLSHFAWPVKP